MFDFNWDSMEKNLQDGALKSKTDFKDDRFWKLARNENDEGSAIIRLLVDPNVTPFIKMVQHNIKFKMPDGKFRWFIEDSPSTIDLPCPASELYRELDSKGDEKSNELKSYIRRKTNYICNILVVKDPLNPENNGKVFLWQFSNTLKDKFLSKIKPKESDLDMGAKAINLFHPMDGASILLKIRKKAENKVYTYEDTEILSPSEAFSTPEEAMKVIKEKTYSLNEFLKPEHFKSYEELTKKLKYTLNLTNGSTHKTGTTTSTVSSIVDSVTASKNNDAPFDTETTAPKVKEKAAGGAELDDLLSELDNM
jgi:hypothetical protein